MFRTDADEAKILVEKLLDENEQRAMNLFRLILSSFAPFAFSDGKEFIIMQTWRDHACMGMVRLRYKRLCLRKCRGYNRRQIVEMRRCSVQRRPEQSEKNA